MKICKYLGHPNIFYKDIGYGRMWYCPGMHCVSSYPALGVWWMRKHHD